ELVQHITSDLCNCVIATANESGMKPGIATLRPDSRAIVGTVSCCKPGEVVIQCPAPLNRGGIENVRATAGLVDCHRPIGLLAWILGVGIAAKASWRGQAERRDLIVVARCI